jgi:hypothetical protein
LKADFFHAIHGEQRQNFGAGAVMTRLLMTGVLAWFLAGGIAVAQGPAPPDAAPDAPPQNSIKLTRVLADLPAGTAYLYVKFTSSFCNRGVTKTWTDGRVAQQVSPFLPSFKAELTGAGYKVVTPGEDNLFDADGASADYEAAAVITNQHVEGCMSTGTFFNERGEMKGTGTMTIDWQVYSRLQKEVVAHITTSGTSKLDHAVQGGVQELVVQAFADNVHQLAQNADFRAAMIAPKALTKGFQMPDQQSRIVLAGSLKTGPRKIADATGSVVTILASTGTGSGFLVSTDGYVLTDAHVVADDKTVRVRWSDGLEGVATVERVSKKRDVAILKTNPRDRSPLPSSAVPLPRACGSMPSVRPEDRNSRARSAAASFRLTACLTACAMFRAILLCHTVPAAARCWMKTAP